jgi:hypothetical protein
VSVVCCHVEVSAKSRSLVQRSPTDCGGSERDREVSIMRRSWLSGGCCAVRKNVFNNLFRIRYNSKAYDVTQIFCKNVKSNELIYGSLNPRKTCNNSYSCLRQGNEEVRINDNNVFL